MSLRTSAGVLAASLTIGLVAAAPATSTLSTDPTPPTTEFEDNGGASWTSHAGEIDFLTEVAQLSQRVEMEVIGRSAPVAADHSGMPLHLVRIGAPGPAPAADARQQPTTLFVCTQHGNEPAGREACLQTIRDLAFTDDPELVRQLQSQTVLFIPTANPAGREANSRGNASGIDINRDHLGLRTPEAKAIAAVIRDYEPDVAADLHEYGPSLPVVYDDELLYLWPRNLNVHEGVRSMARSLAEDYIKAHAIDEGDSADEYGQYKVLDYHVTQTAGGSDEGIARNAIGLRNVASILLETAVTPDVRNGPDELSTGGNQTRRVAHHVRAVYDTLRYMRDLGVGVAANTAQAAAEKAAEGARRDTPVYFGGADNEEPSDDDLLDPPCGYLLDADEATDMTPILELQGIAYERTTDGDVFVPMAQAAEPAIALLLDEKGRSDRGYTNGERLTDCTTSHH